MPDLLLELRSEEIPARMQRKAAGDLKKMLTNGLIEAGLTYETACEYWTPRRLTLNIRGLTAHSKDTHEFRKGPSTKAPEIRINGFLRSAGLNSIFEAHVQNDPKKGDFYVAHISRPGRSTKDIVAELMPTIVKSFPWPKSMRWGPASVEPGSLRWVRPLQSIVCTFGSEIEEPVVINFEVDGIRSGNVTYGHSFHTPKAITVRLFDDYATKLEEAKVVIDADQRREIIITDARNLTFARGLDLIEDDGLLEEISGLVEWPVVLMGRFDDSFLEIPAEIIRLTISAHQKCFVTRQRGKQEALSHHFVLTSNIEAKDGGKEIVHGNDKVVRARLSDALYFWKIDQGDLPDLDILRESAAAFGLDLTKPLDQRMALLDHLGVTFHSKLGTQGARVQRIRALVREIAPLVSAELKLAERAAVLAKADLQTEVVGEFPALQGTMGRKYAHLQGESQSVAAAIEEHYKPHGLSDSVPTDPVSVSVAFADKLDTLIGFWTIDEKPTGSKDPYALRRAALGIVRIILSARSKLPLMKLFDSALAQFTEISIAKKLTEFEAKQNEIDSSDIESEQDIDNALTIYEVDLRHETIDRAAQLKADLLSFFHDRLKVYLLERGASRDLIDAVITPDADDLLTVTRRVEALSHFLDSEDGKTILASTKRGANILTVEEKKGTVVVAAVDDKLFREPAEGALLASVNQAFSEASDAIHREDFSGAMRALRVLCEPVNTFFEQVLVNDENAAVRANRLALLARIRAATNQVADFSKIAG